MWTKKINNSYIALFPICFHCRIEFNDALRRKKIGTSAAREIPRMSNLHHPRHGASGDVGMLRPHAAASSYTASARLVKRVQKERTMKEARTNPNHFHPFSTFFQGPLSTSREGIKNNTETPIQSSFWLGCMIFHTCDHWSLRGRSWVVMVRPYEVPSRCAL